LIDRIEFLDWNTSHDVVTVLCRRSMTEHGVIISSVYCDIYETWQLCLFDELWRYRSQFQ